MEKEPSNLSSEILHSESAAGRISRGKSRKRSLWILFIAFLALLALIAFGLKTGKIRRPENGIQFGQISDQSKGPSDKSCESNPKPVFTSGFTDLENIKQVNPIGGIMVGSPGRSYVQVKGEGASRIKTPLYAPIDTTIQSLVYARRDPNNPAAPGEYRLEFRISCEVTFNFDHIDDVVDKIKAYAPAEPSSRSNDLKYVSIPVKAGELVGYTDGTPQAGSFDLFLLNSAKTVPHINPVRWKWDQVVTADCPYDYFSDELKAKYYDIMRSQDGQVLEPLSCGSPSHDVAGTAAGGWFQGDATDTSGKWLEIGTLAKRVEINRRENGSGNFSVRDYKAKVMPENVTPGNSACYSDTGKWAYIKLNSETEMSVATGSGSCPATFPENQAEAWER
ncbi:MAG: hypothetical protein WCT32_02085 [Patescibacteria group bacterium]|jgi:hypothetical protein